MGSATELGGALPGQALLLAADRVGASGEPGCCQGRRPLLQGAAAGRPFATMDGRHCYMELAAASRRCYMELAASLQWHGGVATWSWRCRYNGTAALLHGAGGAATMARWRCCHWPPMLLSRHIGATLKVHRCCCHGPSVLLQTPPYCCSISGAASTSPVMAVADGGAMPV
jgi:hypothetical protein